MKFMLKMNHKFYKSKFFSAILFCLSLLVIFPIFSAEAAGRGVSIPSSIPPCEPGFLPEQAKVPCAVILQFEEGVPQEIRAAAVKRAGASISFNYDVVDAAAVLVPSIESLRALSGEAEIVRLIPDRIVEAIGKGGKPGGGKGGKGDNTGQVVPSGVTRIGAAPGNLAYKGQGIGVAIIDTGLDLNHGDLNASASGYTSYNSIQDDEGHGTHVGGIVASIDNNVDVVGVSPLAIPYAVKVLDASGRGHDSDVIAGLQWIISVTTEGNLSPAIKVANMSLGREGTINDNPVYRDVVTQLRDMGVSIVVAAGNDSSSEISQQIPAAYPEVIAVASTTANDGNNRCRSYGGFISADTASYFTTDGSGVAVSAPGERAENISRACFIRGEGIKSLKLGGGTVDKSGTSMAAPHVAGIVALMVEKAGGSLDPQIVKQDLINSTNLVGLAPYPSPSSSYTFDGSNEGVVSACGALNVCP
jgi:subtilisin